MNNLHTLTALTGRDAAAQRTVVFKGFEARRRTAVVLAVGAAPAVMLTTVMWMFIGVYAVLCLPAVEGATWWLLETRSRNGLQQRTYETLLDRRRSDAGQFFMCGRVIDPDLNELGTVVLSTVPAPARTPMTAGSVDVAPQPVTGLAPTDPVPLIAPGVTVPTFDAGDLFGAQR